jgi:hypothetical protein
MAEIDVTEINVAYPEASSLHLKVAVGACRLKLSPGAGEAWVTGTYKAPAGALPAKIEQEDGMVRISQEYRVSRLSGLFSKPPSFDLALGKATPYEMSLEVGATESIFDLGGLPITRLSIKQGAGKADFDFSALNPQPMSLLDIDAGAVSLEMKNLANANFAEMRVDGGAASYKFDFSGKLERDAHARITAGMSAVEISVPASTPARIASESVIAGLNIGDGFTKKEGAFWTEAALAGDGPVLTIRVSVSLGSLAIRAN